MWQEVWDRGGGGGGQESGKGGGGGGGVKEKVIVATMKAIQNTSRQHSLKILIFVWVVPRLKVAGDGDIVLLIYICMGGATFEGSRRRRHCSPDLYLYGWCHV